MTIKWSKKEAIKHLQELRSPFENLGPGQEKPALSNIAERIKALVARNKGIRPQ